MKLPNFKIFFKVALSIVLSLGLVVPVIAAENTTKSTTPVSTTKINPLYINLNSSVTLKDIASLQSNAGQYVSFTLSIYNGENQDIQFIDY